LSVRLVDLKSPCLVTLAFFHTFCYPVVRSEGRKGTGLTDIPNSNGTKRRRPTRGFGYHIRVKRAMLGISQDDLAKRVGLSQSALSRIEKGASDPKLSHVVRIAKELGLDLNEICLKNDS